MHGTAFHVHVECMYFKDQIIFVNGFANTGQLITVLKYYRHFLGPLQLLQTIKELTLDLNWMFLKTVQGRGGGSKNTL